MKAVRGEEEEEEEEEVEAPLGGCTVPQKPDFSDFFRAPAGDGIPAKNHDEEDEERVRGTVFCLYFNILVSFLMHLQWWRGDGGRCVCGGVGG